MRLWRERNFRLLFVGQSVSALGNSLVPVVLAFAVLRATGSPADLGIVLGAEAATQVVLLLIGGAIADRLPRRRVMVGSDLLRGAAEGVLGALLLAGDARIGTIIALNALQGVGAALFNPAATGLLPSVVSEEDLLRTNGYQQTALAASKIAGPALAGILVVTVGAGWAIVADAASFVLNAGALGRLRLERDARVAPRRFLTDLASGVRDFWGRRWFRSVVIGASLFNLVYATYLVLGPLVSLRDYHGAATWATVTTAQGIGAVVGGLVAMRIHHLHPLRPALVAVALVGLAPLAFGISLPIAAVTVSAGIGGFGMILFSALWDTAVQRHIPPAQLSRASSYDYFGSLVVFPIGLAIAAPTATAVGLRRLLGISGVLEILLLSGLLVLPSVRNLPERATEGDRGPD